MKPSLCCLLAVLLIGLVPVADAQVTRDPVSDEDRASFRVLYHDKLTSVQRTPTVKDDLKLAQDMMAFAREIPGDPGVQCLIYIEVIPLASASSDLVMMRQAILFLETLWPGHEAVSVENQLDLAAKGYRAVSRSSDQKTEVGEAYIELLMGLAQRSEMQDNLDEAINISRIANTIARAIDSEQREAIGMELERMGNEQELTDRVERLALSVQKNPQNSPAARELVYLLVKKRNDPSAASQYVQSTSDEELIDLVNHAARGIEQASAAVAMRVADWYRLLAEDEPDPEAEVLLSNAMDWYQHFALAYTREDALAKRVHIWTKATSARLKVLREKMGIKDQAGWTSLVEGRFDPEEHSRRGTVRVVNDQIQCTACQLLFPTEIDQAYEFEVTFKVMEIEEIKKPLMFLIPVGETFVRLRYNYAGPVILSSDRKELRHEIEGRENDLLKSVTVLVRVSTYEAEVSEDDEEEDEQRIGVRIAVALNGEEAMRWEGEVGDLEDEEEFDLPEDAKEGFRVLVRNQMIWERVQYRSRVEKQGDDEADE